MPRPDSRATGPSAPGTVEITQSGRGGSITYREGENTVAFDWEFGASPAIALIFGPTAQAWDRQYPWAAGRQAEIYDFVGAEAVRTPKDGWLTWTVFLPGRSAISISRRTGWRVPCGSPSAIPAKP